MEQVDSMTQGPGAQERWALGEQPGLRPEAPAAAGVYIHRGATLDSPENMCLKMAVINWEEGLFDMSLDPWECED